MYKHITKNSENVTVSCGGSKLQSLKTGLHDKNRTRFPSNAAENGMGVKTGLFRSGGEPG